MRTIADENIESKFSSLPDEEKVSVISHGVALRLSEWKKRLFLAESKVRFFEEKYRMSRLSWIQKDCRMMLAMKCTKTISCGITGRRRLKRQEGRS